FAAGPAILPLPVLERARQDIVSLPGVGASPLEVGHRSPWFTSVIEETGLNLHDLLGVPDGYHVVFCQGGASLQFSMVAMNLLRG
ncbi:MAG: aminotransferase class V-fold PLP-dependent enzyme, partial [Actinobacteria bacterium]